jgi:hypothetical protein
MPKAPFLSPPPTLDRERRIGGRKKDERRGESREVRWDKVSIRGLALEVSQ